MQTFRDIRVFVLSPMPKNENSEITEILQNHHNIEIWECNFENSWDLLQITSVSKWSAIFPNNCQLFVF